MKKNIGSTDRLLRIIAGIALVLLVAPDIHVISWGTTLVLFAGSILVITGLFGVCPLYSLFGISTRKKGTR
jgi:hypothetical protein